MKHHPFYLVAHLLSLLNLVLYVVLIFCREFDALIWVLLYSVSMVIALSTYASIKDNQEAQKLNESWKQIHK